jgi:hypothetical protein
LWNHSSKTNDIVDAIENSNYLAECILSENHEGPHVFQTPNNKCFAWENDPDCGCCAPEEVKNELFKEVESLGLTRADEETKGYDTHIYQLGLNN